MDLTRGWPILEEIDENMGMCGGWRHCPWYAFVEDHYAVMGKKCSIFEPSELALDFPAVLELGPCFDVMFLTTVDDVILGGQIFPFCHVSVSPPFCRLGFGIYDPPSTTVNSYWLVEWLSCSSAKLRTFTEYIK